VPGYNAYSQNYWLLFLPYFLLENGFLSYFSLNCLFPCKLFSKEYSVKRASVVAQKVKNPPPMQDVWVKSLDREDPVRREWLPTPVFLPEESRGQRSLAGYSPWGRKESDTTEQLSACARVCTRAHTHTHKLVIQVPKLTRNLPFSTKFSCTRKRGKKVRELREKFIVMNWKWESIHFLCPCPTASKS